RSALSGSSRTREQGGSSQPTILRLRDTSCDCNCVTYHVRWDRRLGRLPERRIAMPNAVVMTGYGPPDVLKWAQVPLTEPGQGQIRIKVKAAGISPTDLALRAGYLKDAIPLPPDAVLGFEAAGTVDAVGAGVTGVSPGDGVTALLFSLGGYAEYALASIWARKPDTVSWIDAAALPSSANAAVGVLAELNVTTGET